MAMLASVQVGYSVLTIYDKYLLFRNKSI